MLKKLFTEKRSNKHVIVTAAATLMLFFGSLTPSQARVEMITSQSYINASGCIIIIETYQHSFLGIDLWQTTDQYSPNCD